MSETSSTPSEKRQPYPFDQIEAKWQARWEQEKTFRTANPGEADFDASKPKFFVLDMFPYPSGDGLHVGHPEGYTATDIVSRYKRKKGFNVLHPMGWDAFGLPAEQYAIKTGQHPRVTTERNVSKFTQQLKRLGFDYDWSREVNTTDPGYFRWTQWIFIQLYHSWFNPQSQKVEPISTYAGREPDQVRLAYVAEVPVNWCPGLGTVLANEEVIDGKSEVGSFPVERRPMKQWMLRITALADRLAEEIDPCDWPEGIKQRQKEWIGRSEGAEVHFSIVGAAETLTVFTTRPDTLFGATYMVLAPEHPLVSSITSPDQRDAVAAYQKETATKSDLDRGVAKNKTGVATGAKAINPVNGAEIPIWIADYVMMGYGTGAIMAVPAHDERDFEFAQTFHLPVIQVVAQRGTGVSPVSSISPYFDPAGITKASKRHLPHWDQGQKAYFITWRLADSLPQDKLSTYAEEKANWLKNNPEPHNPDKAEEFNLLFADTIEKWLDSGHGSCLLKNQSAADIVHKALMHFDGDRYHLSAHVIMPNHVHVLFTLNENQKLSEVLHSLKSFTAHEINKLNHTSGKIWQDESFDRLIRSESHWNKVISYITDNPKVAGTEKGEFLSYLADSAPQKTGETPAPPSAATPGDGIAINSGFLDGLPTATAKKKIISWLVEKSLGVAKVNYKLRDWLFARQRYWGEPFPVIWENGQHRTVTEAELPVMPPDLDDFKPTGTPEPPLSKATDWVKYSATATRELNTMPQWAGSCWYYLRYCDPKNTERFVSQEAEAYWMKGGVDLYIGGTEHAVLHLLYARFWHKVLFDLGHVTTREPFHKLVNQGLILGEDMQKMSKSRGNVINPDAIVHEFGADSLRLFEMFMGPLEQVKPWSTKGVEGVNRFLGRVWRLFMEQNQAGEWQVSSKVQRCDATPSQLRVLHQTIKKIGEDCEALSFNTAIAQMMVCVNEFTSAEVRSLDALTTFLHLLNPYAPHLTEELYEKMNHTFTHLPSGLLSHLPWPAYDPELLINREAEFVVQINGKVRDKFTADVSLDSAALEALTLARPKVKEYTDGKEIKKIIIVPKKLVNLVVAG